MIDEDTDAEAQIVQARAESTDPSQTRNGCTKFFATSLITIGSVSEGAQSLFGLSQAFGLNNVLSSFGSKGKSALTLAQLIYILFGSSTTAIQSFCLEYPYAFDFFDDPLNLVRADSEPALHLNPLELILLTGITFLGACIRGVVSVMGYYALSNDIHLALKVVIYLSTVFEVSQTVMTDGTYLQKAYLWLRSNKKDPQQQAAIMAKYDHESGENPLCNTWDSLAVYASCLVLASLSVLGEVGLGLIALQQCARKNNWNSQSAGFYGLAALTLTSYFLMMSAIDSASPAKIATLWYEQRKVTHTPDSAEVAPRSGSQQSIYGLAVFISLNGSAVKALGTYSGMSFLLSKGLDDQQAILGLSIVIGLIRFLQCYAVEGVATIDAFTVDNSQNYQRLSVTDPFVKPKPLCESCCSRLSWRQAGVNDTRNSTEGYSLKDLLQPLLRSIPYTGNKE